MTALNTEPNVVIRAFPLDVARLGQEIAQFNDAEWRKHPVQCAGTESIALITVGGGDNQDYAQSGPLRETPALARCPYLRQVLARLGVPLGRCRLTRLAGHGHTPWQKAWHYHWFRRAPVLIPVSAHPPARLFRGLNSYPLAANTAVRYDPCVPYRMRNPGAEPCVHLVVETRQAPEFLDSESPGEPVLETFAFEVFTEQEFHQLTGKILDEWQYTSGLQRAAPRMPSAMATIRTAWNEAFQQFGQDFQGELRYQNVLLNFRDLVARPIGPWLSPTGPGAHAVAVIQSLLATAPPAPKRVNIPLLIRKRRKRRLPKPEKTLDIRPPRFERPIFIVSAPRAGSTLLFNLLTRFPEVWSIGGESHDIIEAIPALHPASHGYRSNRLTSADARAETVAMLQSGFARELQNRDQISYWDFPEEKRPPAIRFVEKTPKNALRVAFLRAAFPGALFIYLYRDPRENISSLLEGWRSRRYVSYQPLPGWPYMDWSFLLPPGWEAMKTASLVEIAAFQWRMANHWIMADLRDQPASSWLYADYASLVRTPVETLARIARFAGLTLDERVEKTLAKSLPISVSTLSTPAPDKWKKNEHLLQTVQADSQPIINAAAAFARSSCAP